jgi:hypothetical protein
LTYIIEIMATHKEIGAVMVSVLVPSAVDRGIEPRRVEPKTIKLVFVASPQMTQHAIRKKNKDWLARNQDNVSEWDDMSIRRLFFQ